MLNKTASKADIFTMEIPDLQSLWSSLLELYYRGVFTYDNQSLLGKILIVETVLICLSMAFLFFFHKINNRKLVKLKKSQFQLNELCLKFIEHSNADMPTIIKNCQDLSLCIPTLENLNREHSENIQWLFFIDELLDETILPKARLQARAFWWTKRNWALRALSLSPRKKDEALFLNFLMDPVAHNRFAAIRPLLKIGSDSSKNIVIELMKQENRHTQAVFIEMMKFGGEQLLEVIRKRLKNDPSPDAKRVCIDLLSESLEESDLFLIKQSLHSTNKSLRLTAIRCLGKFNNYHSTQILLGFLEDQEWEVRSLAAKFLGIQEAYQAIPNLLTNTSDRNWWVRMNSVSALNNMGYSGKVALETITPEKDRYAYEMVQYVYALESEMPLTKDSKEESEKSISLLKFDPSKKKGAA